MEVLQVSVKVLMRHDRTDGQPWARAEKQRGLEDDNPKTVG